MVRRPSVVHTFKLKYLWSQLANLDQILCVALGWGKGCIRFCSRLDQNSGFHGNRKPSLTYNGENDVSTFSRLLLIRSFLYLQVTRIYITSRTSSNFGQKGPMTTEPLSLIRVFAVRMKKAWVPSYPLSTQRRLGAHSFCWFCHVAAHLRIC